MDVIGLSILSGAHMELFPKIFDALEERGIGGVIVVAGGIIPEADRPPLEAMGVKAIFGPGATTTQIAEFIRGAVEQRSAAAPAG